MTVSLRPWIVDYDQATDQTQARRDLARDSDLTPAELKAQQQALRADYYARHPEAAL